MSDSTCDNDNDEEVGFRAFRFAGQLDTPSNALVTFEVTAIVCLPDELGNQCYLDCLECNGLVSDSRKRRSLRDGNDCLECNGLVSDSRKRRSLRDGNRIKEAKFYLKAGPYKFATVGKKNQQGVCLFL